ncbi:hypothetical protein PITC_069600 [Penicillium italicum]|uniref:Uncharacterized protein n=1 Tax=Penicillium italicum TaxID=40296 RepID=A0A0A2KL91_PENIT|nr:hypothetical protein PITC_069600 [Penicillium italicum]
MPRCQPWKVLKRDNARVNRISIGQEVIKCPFFRVSATLMVVLIRYRLRA